MITGKLNTIELLEAFDSTSSQLLQLASSFTGKEFSTLPFAGNWTAAQVCEHIIKSNESIAQALKEKGKTTVREPGQRVLELQELFLNFTKKFQSPEAVLPARDGYKKETFIHDLEKTTGRVKELSETVNIFETVNIPGFGELTKLELLHFIIFHTQRHIQQLKNVLEVVVNSPGLPV